MGRKRGSVQSVSDQNHSAVGAFPHEFEVEPNPKKMINFKNKAFEAAKSDASNKKARVFKNLKQILLHERSLQWSEEDVDCTYSSIDALPSFKPQKKYSDISGIPAVYTDPHSKLRFASAEEFSRIKTLPNDIVAGLLSLRRAGGSNA